MGFRVPNQNEPKNLFERQVIGNKTDTAEGGSSLVSLAKAAAGARYAPVTNYYVDTTLGSATGDGLSPGSAFNTITLAMTAAAALGTRGRVKIHVAPGGYNEDVITPLNSECPFGELIGYSPTERSFGAAYIYASTAGEPALTVRARGWKISGFEFGALANAECIHLKGTSAGGTPVDCNPGGLLLENCIIGGWAAAGSIGIDITGNGAPLTVLRNCHFNGIRDKAITCSESGTDQPRFWEIDDCTFVDNNNHIAMTGRGFKESVIHDCRFMQVGANYTATLQLDNRGGNACVIGPHNFFSGTYDGATGGYYDGTNQSWGGNWNIAGVTAANPA